MNDRLEFMRRYFWIKPKQLSGRAGGTIRFVPNRAQIYVDQNWARRLIVLKARQLGSSTYVQARFFYDAIMEPGVSILTLAHDPKGTANLFEMSRTFYANLPEHMRPERKYNSAHLMSFPGLGSTLSIGTANTKTFGRGPTVHRLHCSEFAYWPWPEETFGGIEESVPTECPIVIESTPSGAWGAFYDMSMKAIAGQGAWKLIFMPWWFDDGYALQLFKGETLEPFSPEETSLIQRHALSQEQIKWRRMKIAEMSAMPGSGQERFFREYPEDPITCFSVGGSCFFDVSDVRVISQYAYAEPLDVKGETWIWKEPSPHSTYVIGADVASGSEGDDLSAFTVQDKRTGQRVAVCNALLNTLQFSKELTRIGHLYGDAVIAVERNALGAGVIERIAEDGYPNIYFHLDSRAGWPTTSVTRPIMLDDLRHEVRECVMYGDFGRIPDRRILDQMIKFRKAKGPGDKPQAGHGAHDDLIMADAITSQVRTLDIGGGGAVF